MRPVPAGRQRGQCCTPYSRLQEEIDNVETIAVTANNTANNAANAANTAVNTANTAIAGLDDKVDQLSTVGKYAYTHDGSTQGEIAVEDGTTADTIPIKDSNGRMQAADPASGATDKTLVTANWISQTGTGRPNNLIHDSGTEIMSGLKLCNNITGKLGPNQRVTATSKIEMFRIAATASNTISLRIMLVSRGGTKIVSVTITTDASSNISNMTGSAVDLTGTDTCYIYAYTIDGNIIIGTGNESSRNYIYSYTALLTFAGAGISNTSDFSQTARSITTEYAAAADAKMVTV